LLKTHGAHPNAQAPAFPLSVFNKQQKQNNFFFQNTTKTLLSMAHPKKKEGSASTACT